MSDVPRFFAACDIDVLCSISESFPYSILEGIREGCAVITSDVGGMSRLITHGEDGYIFQRATSTPLPNISWICPSMQTSAAVSRSGCTKKPRSPIRSKECPAQYEIYEDICAREARRASRRRDGVLICGAYGRGNAGDEAILRPFSTPCAKSIRSFP